MIVVDTNVFVIDLRYRRDALFPVNRRFLDRLAVNGSGATTVFNLLELAGILSFNLNDRQLRDLVAFFPGKYGISVIPAFDRTALLPRAHIGGIMDRIAQRCSFGDAMVLEAVEEHAPARSRFVSWDADHFTGRTRLEVLTPDQILRKWNG